MTPTELYLLATTITCSTGSVLLGQRFITWKCRALELEAELVHGRLGRMRLRRRFKPAYTPMQRKSYVRDATYGRR